MASRFLLGNFKMIAIEKEEAENFKEAVNKEKEHVYLLEGTISKSLHGLLRSRCYRHAVEFLGNLLIVSSPS